MPIAQVQFCTNSEVCMNSDLLAAARLFKPQTSWMGWEVILASPTIVRRPSTYKLTMFCRIDDNEHFQFRMVSSCIILPPRHFFFALCSVRSMNLTSGEYTRYAPMAPGKKHRPPLHRLQTHLQLRKKEMAKMKDREAQEHELTSFRHFP